MRHHLFAQGAAIALLVLGPSAGAFAGPATDQLKPRMEKVIATIESPALQGEAKTAERRQAVRAITDSIFDWTEMARRTLGPHWEARTAAERKEFVALFRDLMERAYVGKIERYGAEQIAYLGEAPDGKETMVRTRVTLKPGLDVTVDYRMARRGARWMITDIVIGAVSQVSNYRAQFAGVMKTASYPELVRKIRALLS
jgi:phospholipid transport system substrate-binding protein